MEAKVEGRWCNFLVNAGSNLKVLHLDVMEAFSAKILQKAVLGTVTGEAASVLGRGNLQITLGNCETK